MQDKIIEREREQQFYKTNIDKGVLFIFIKLLSENFIRENGV